VQGRDGLAVGLPAEDQIIQGDAEELGELGQLLQRWSVEPGFILGQVGMADGEPGGQFFHGPPPGFSEFLDAPANGGTEDGINGERGHEAEHRGVSVGRVDKYPYNDY